MPDSRSRHVFRFVLSHLACSIVAFHAGSFYALSSCIPSRMTLPDPPYQRLSHLGIKTIDRQSILDTFDMGYPRGPKGGDGLLINLAKLQPEYLPLRSNAVAATAECDVVKVIQTNATSCVIIVEGQDEYHVSKWTRQKQSWRPVSRFQGTTVTLQNPPKPVSTKLLDHMLQNYLTHLSMTLDKLRPIAARIAKSANPLVIMVCNAGHVEILLNFVCASRNVGVDLSSYLIFATDLTTKTLVSSWGLSVVYFPNLFPTIHNNNDALSVQYGSIPYAHAMLSKVLCAQLISLLGHDFVFQDVDMVPYRADYVQHFISFADQHDDLLFQYDHSSVDSPQYQPWSANSGFYYVRSNIRTKYLLTSLLRQGDLILRAKSHQAALSILLSEHSSLFGLQVKVLHNASEDFPGASALFSFCGLLSFVSSPAGDDRAHVLSFPHTHNKIIPTHSHNNIIHTHSWLSLSS
jgi:Nucleotide-diphospho-sugar transferase